MAERIRGNLWWVQQGRKGIVYEHGGGWWAETFHSADAEERHDRLQGVLWKIGPDGPFRTRKAAVECLLAQDVDTALTASVMHAGGGVFTFRGGPHWWRKVVVTDPEAGVSWTASRGPFKTRREAKAG